MDGNGTVLQSGQYTWHLERKDVKKSEIQGLKKSYERYEGEPLLKQMLHLLLTIPYLLPISSRYIRAMLGQILGARFMQQRVDFDVGFRFL